MKKEKWYEKFNDERFIKYYKSGEATAVYIVRDLAEDVKTRGKWIDVLPTTNNYYSSCGRLEFNWIIVELFPRITNPKYKKDDKEYNKYLCWQAAHEDIEKYHEKKHNGEKYIVLCVPYFDEEYGRCKYKVLASHSINQKKINYIKSNADNIIEQIRKTSKPTLPMFHIEN